ncbi:MAG: DUF4834 family protein [Bacteroidaceae bacterium]|nr:DUF4834 family protein [Bacteroidaceae bacterium]
MFLFILILFLFLFLFFVPTLFLSIVTRVLSLFSFGSRKRKMHGKKDAQDDTSSYTYTQSSKKRNEKKIFDKNEGEYVDFEEIK